MQRFKLMSSGLWHCIMLQYDTSVLEDLTASIFRVKVLRNIGTLLHYYMASWPRRRQLESSLPRKSQSHTNTNIFEFKVQILNPKFLTCYHVGTFPYATLHTQQKGRMRKDKGKEGRKKIFKRFIWFWASGTLFNNAGYIFNSEVHKAIILAFLKVRLKQLWHWNDSSGMISILKLIVLKLFKVLLEGINENVYFSFFKG
jgi:hypothetical protein